MAREDCFLRSVRQFLATTVLAVLPLITATALGQSTATLITFDAPGAGTGHGQGTFPYSMNADGVIAGTVVGTNGLAYGFLRHPDGTFTSIRVPVARDTFVYSVNDSGTVTGSFDGASTYGFLRTSDGKITYFRPTGTQFLYQNTIDNLGNVAGTFLTTFDFFECYIRSSNGTITTFTPPGGFECRTNDIVAGTVSGTYGDPAGFNSPFLRNPDGSFTVFLTGNQANGAVINPQDTAAGSFVLSNGLTDGYIHAANGTITYFGLPVATAFVVADINSAGALTGNYTRTSDAANHGFQRRPDGSLEILNAPGAGSGQFQGTFPYKINDAGAITGLVVDANQVSHGFLFTP